MLPEHRMAAAREKDPLSQFYCTENMDCFAAFP